MQARHLASDAPVLIITVHSPDLGQSPPGYSFSLLLC